MTTSPAEPVASPSVRIATYNFLQGGSARRTGHLARLLRECDPAIVLCQEARPTPGADQAPGDDAFLWRAVPGSRWGSAVLVRARPARMLEVPGYEGWVLGAEVELGRHTRVFSIHCPVGEKGYVRAMHAILDAVAPLAEGADLVLGGDFNVAVGYRGQDERVRMSRGERELLDRIGADFGLMACWQAAHPGVPLAQTLRWSAERRAPYHCDGIFVPAAWRPRLRGCEILCDAEWERLSDHNPVVAELALQAPTTDAGEA